MNTIQITRDRRIKTNLADIIIHQSIALVWTRFVGIIIITAPTRFTAANILHSPVFVGEILALITGFAWIGHTKVPLVAQLTNKSMGTGAVEGPTVRTAGAPVLARVGAARSSVGDLTPAACVSVYTGTLDLSENQG